ncbi:tyrosinase family protein [Stieleria sp. TO1_6]|uniref:tyrosinase family protein n=1 Tax=Stieleria tagensis TaxID=2956795 RepID=UPI00209AAE70|nr:tyrosinase family protein [Stieleria tagensis]MCO8124446.1 tyrosinase family protein [Stieleria tagensis]
MFRFRSLLVVAAFVFIIGPAAAQDRATVPEITEVETLFLKTNPPGLVVVAEGEVTSGGHTDVRLDRVLMVMPPADGYQIYRLSTIPPTGPATAQISAVSANNAWPNFELEAPWIRGVRVLGVDHCGMMEKPLQRRVRRNIRDLSDDEIESLRQGIAVMKSRPASDRTSWTFQANMHGTFTGSDPLFNQCQHGTLHFLSWHRIYLYHFEQILAEAAGDPDLTLPYWDWTNDRALPLEFREPADASNSLFDDSRSINQGALLPTSVVGDDLADAMARNSFSGFSGFNNQLEGSPHGAVHVLIGGRMGSVPTAANDPIFWLHHCNIDRLWDHWLNSSSVRQNPDSTGFLNQMFPFAAADGTVVSSRVGDHLYSRQLGYSYDTTPAPTVSSVESMMVAMGGAPAMHGDESHGDDSETPSAGAAHGHQMNSNQRDPYHVVASSKPTGEPGENETPGSRGNELKLQPHRVTLEKSNDAELPFAAVTAASRQSEDVLIELVGLKFDHAPAVGYTAYLNLPQDVDSDERRKLYRLGVVNLFGAPLKSPSGEARSTEHDHGLNQRFDATKTIARLKSMGLWKGDEMVITLLPITATAPPEQEQAYLQSLQQQVEKANVRYDEIRLLAK